MSSYYRPYFENSRERDRDSRYDGRRFGRRYGYEDDDFERGSRDFERGFREFRGRDPYESRGWRSPDFREPFDPDDPHPESESGRGRFNQFEDWERPRELSTQQSYRRFGRGRYESYGRYAGRGPKGYQRSDERLKEEACDRLTADPDVDATDIEVSVQGGEVTLDGSVCERRMKRDAEDCVESIHGVREVHNRIRVDTRHEPREETGERESMGAVGRFLRGSH